MMYEFQKIQPKLKLSKFGLKLGQRSRSHDGADLVKSFMQSNMNPLPLIIKKIRSRLKLTIFDLELGQR